MEYNSNRPDLAIPEYGRNIQNMVEYTIGIADREERNKAAKTIIRVMGQLFPHLRDIEDYNHKLWDHLHIMADFKLDVDSPYPVPNPDELKEGPKKVNYPGSGIKYDHYGKYLEEFIKLVANMDAGPERDRASIKMANLMKTNYANHNQTHVDDRVILKQLSELSGGVLTVDAPDGLADPVLIPQQNPSRQGKRKKKKKSKNRQQNAF
jgi:hypothetical protein